MPLKPPKYIPIELISKRDITHVWDDWDPFEPLANPTRETKEALKRVSNIGISAFATGCAEWVVYRLSRSFNDTAPYNYLEAFWVYLHGCPEALPPETEHEEWLGTVRGPINLSLMTILNTVYLAEGGPPVQNGALAAQVALHVLVDKDKFLNWQAQVLKRLLIYSPRQKDAPDGTPIPREVLDSSVDLNPVGMDQLNKEFLANVDYKSNPLLAEMKPPIQPSDEKKQP